MQRHLGLALFAVFAYALVGIYPAQWALRELARQEMGAYIKEGGAPVNAVVSFTFTSLNDEVNAPGFAWEEENEFSYNGGLYDVLGREQGEGTITFHCLADARENAIVQNGKKLIPLGAPGRSSTGGSNVLIKFMGEHYLPKAITDRALFSSEGRIEHPRCETAALTGFASSLLRPPVA